MWLSGENRKANRFTPDFQVFTALECWFRRWRFRDLKQSGVSGTLISVLWVSKKGVPESKPAVTMAILPAASGGTKSTASKR